VHPDAHFAFNSLLPVFKPTRDQSRESATLVFKKLECSLKVTDIFKVDYCFFTRRIRVLIAICPTVRAVSLTTEFTKFEQPSWPTFWISPTTALSVAHAEPR